LSRAGGVAVAVVLMTTLLVTSVERLAAAEFVDAVLAAVEERTITASDIALLRVLRLFGFAPSAAPIDSRDVERAIDAWLVVREAQRLRLGGATEGRAEAWNAVVKRFGGAPALEAWLDRAAVEQGWARRLVEEYVDWQQFVDLRFRAFVFVTEDQILSALAGTPDTPESRARAVATLEAAEVERRLAEWIAETRPGVAVHRLLAPNERVPVPLPLP
jgi:hypothetical protein